MQPQIVSMNVTLVLWLSFALQAVFSNKTEHTTATVNASDVEKENDYVIEYSDFDLSNYDLTADDNPKSDLWYWCNALPAFTPSQVEFCEKRPNYILAFDTGGENALESCRQYFTYHKWNCTQGVLRPSFMHFSMQDGSAEAAVLAAFRGAGLTYETARRCDLGSLGDCGCADRRQARRNASGVAETWLWRGCSQQLFHADRLVSEFVESEAPHDDVRLDFATAHNFGVGQRVLDDALQLNCKCHGVSGSCTLRTCFPRLPRRLSNMADRLGAKYRGARRAVAGRQSPPLVDAETGASPRVGDLIFTSASIEPCAETSFVDPRDRPCLLRADDAHPDTCSDVCCGRGWRVVEQSCDCAADVCPSCPTQPPRRYCL